MTVCDHLIEKHQNASKDKDIPHQSKVDINRITKIEIWHGFQRIIHSTQKAVRPDFVSSLHIYFLFYFISIDILQNFINSLHSFKSKKIFRQKSWSKNFQLYIESPNLEIWVWNIKVILLLFITSSSFMRFVEGCWHHWHSSTGLWNNYSSVSGNEMHNASWSLAVKYGL